MDIGFTTNIDMVNNSASQLLVQDSTGTCWPEVSSGLSIASMSRVTVAKFEVAILGMNFGWIHLQDLSTGARYQIFVKCMLAILVPPLISQYFGYFDPSSSVSKANPKPFPAGCATPEGKVNQFEPFTLLVTPPVVD